MKKQYLNFIFTFIVLTIFATINANVLAYKGTINDTAATEIINSQYDFNAGDIYYGTVMQDEKIPGIYLYRHREDENGILYKYHTHQDGFEAFYRDTDGAQIYCIQSFYGIKGSYHGSHKMYKLSDVESIISHLTVEQMRTIELIAYYGAGYTENGYNHVGNKWIAATQQLIWRTERPTWIHNFTDSSFNNVLTSYDDEMEEIMQLVEEHYITPDFTNYKAQISMEESITITDKNGVLSKYFTVQALDDKVQVQKNGNSITITGLQPGKSQIRLVKQSNRFPTPTIIYFSTYVPEGRDYSTEGFADEDVQDMMYPGNYTPIVVDLDIEVVGGKATIEKVDTETGSTAQGDATLVNAVYGVYDSAGTLVETLTINNSRTATTKILPYGVYTVKEITAPIGYNLSNERYTLTINENNTNVKIYVKDSVVKGSLEIQKRLGALDYDNEINLAGAQFKATLKSDTSKVYYSNLSGIDGICRINNLPYGEYEIEESRVPAGAEKVANFTAVVSENGRTYEYTKVDASKDMKIEVFKELLVNNGEKTDAKISGAEFTVYRDANCTDKVCVIGPTDANGYAISGTMRTGTYYLKETKFPEGIDPDAIIPGENVTYRNKVYIVTHNNQTQGTETVTVPLTVKNEPKRNDIEIIKKIGATSNTSIAPLDKCEFTATLKSSIGTDNVFSRKCTAETDANGYCVIEDLPYGEYIVEETKVSPIALKCENFTVFVSEDSKVKVEPYSKTIVDEPKVMQIKIRKVDANRKDTDAPDFTQGDATLEGAIYQIFRYDPQTDDYTEAVYEITVDHKDADGYWCAESDDLLVGKYMVKEKISYTEVVDGKTYNYSYAEGYLADPETYYFDQRPDLQTVKRTYHYDTSKEEVIRGSVEVIKYDNDLGETDETAAEGAILRLTLNSDSNKYYDVTINENGYGEFVEEESRDKYYPYTIPYGEYTITEIKESDAKEHTSFFIQPESVIIRKQVQKEYRIEADEPVEMYLRIQKTDKDTGADVKLAGARFKVWDCQKDEWVSQITYPSGEYIDEFETGEDGNLTLPHKLEAGNYIVYETQAPAGYYLEEAWRIPENEAHIGNADKGGKLVIINKAAMDMEENTSANTIDLYYTEYMPNEPLKGKLEIFKTGEMLTDSIVTSTEYGEKYTPVYNQKGLSGVTYEIIAAEDIKSPDGNVTYVPQGTKVDTITTSETGIATTKDLYLGEYEIKEVVTPVGYIIDEDIENVVLENKDTLTKVEVTEKSLTNIRQKLKLTFTKEYEEINFVNGKDTTKYSVFGVYTNQDIKNTEGTTIIAKNNLVDVIKIEGEEENVTSTIDLPQGKYYICELDASYPYSLSEEVVYIELKHDGNENKYITTRADNFTNTYDSATIELIKISTASLENVMFIGDKIDSTIVDAQVNQIINDIEGMSSQDITEYLKENNIKYLSDAKYKIYLDEECTMPLYLKQGNEFVEAELTTDENGKIILENLPLGKYFVKEIQAPENHELAEEIVEIDLNEDDKDKKMYRILVDDGLVTRFISKIDIFTSEAVPNCTFEIKSKTGDLKIIIKTDEGGNAHIPVALFNDDEVYTYTEIEAPGIYNLNTEPHEFVAEFDENGEWITEPIVVENYRKESTVTLEKLDFADSTAIPNCKFELRSLETDFVVEGVTDENGIYVFENIPYGKYTYTELEAPEEYIIDTTPHEVEINAEQMKIQVTNEKAPETGDIQLVTIAGILVVSVVGITYVIKNKKELVK